MGTRCVVTGIVDGKSVIVSDETVEPVIMGSEITPVWGRDDVPSFPLDASRIHFTRMFPAAGGYRFIIMTIPPDGTEFTMPNPADLVRLGDMTAGMLAHPGEAPGMHTTDTVDMEVVISGEASQEFDDGQVVHLKPGDCLIQNGTKHRWFNRGTEPAHVAVFVVGGHPRNV